MGADFIGSFIAWPTASKDDALAALAAKTDDELDMLYDYLKCADPDNPVDARQWFSDQLVTFYETMVTYGRERSREVAVWDIDGTSYIVSGGLSWGESPTDACEVIDAVAALNVTDRQLSA
jgi:hypothetical protein